MKKFFALFTVVLMIVAMAVTASAEATYLAEQDIPYATTAPTLDGVMSEGEWTTKFTMNGSNSTNVAGAPPAAFNADIYMAWDETYLYIAYDVTDDNGGRLYYGADGDNLTLFLDVNGIAEANGNGNMHAFNVSCFPVVAAAGSKDASGYHTRYGATDHEGSPDKLVQNDAACAGAENKWVIEQRVAWADLNTLLGTAYQGQTLPTVAPGVVVSFMPSYHDCGTGNACVGWYIGQNKGVSDAPAAIPSCYGFRGTLAAAPAPEAPETPDAPATADALSFGIMMGAVALAGAALVIGKKKAN